jgi:hypothetical protein
MATNLNNNTNNNTKDIDNITNLETEGTNKKIIEWTQDHENIIIEWADKALCYRWLHAKANAKYSKQNAWYTIPVIIISTLTGTANFAQERVPIQYQSIFVMLVGGLNLLAGIITTIQQFLKITQLNESHRVSGIAWDKFYRNIKIQLAKHPDERQDVTKFIDNCKEEFDRLMDTSPNIPKDVIKSFKSTFKDTGDFNNIIKPEICDEIEPTANFRNQWYTDENVAKRHNESLKMNISRELKAKKQQEQNIKAVTDFKTNFFNFHNREAMDDEVIDNLKDQIELSIIKKILSETPMSTALTIV